MTWWAPWIGREFDAKAFNCWTLVCETHRERLGIELPSYAEIEAGDLIRVARTMTTRKDDGWVPVNEPDEMDVVLMRSGRGGRMVVHVGVATGPRHVLHVEEASAAVLVPMSHFTVAGRITGFRRHAKHPRCLS